MVRLHGTARSFDGYASSAKEYAQRPAHPVESAVLVGNIEFCATAAVVHELRWRWRRDGSSLSR